MSDSPPALFLTPEKQWPEQTFNEYCAGLRERIGARVEVAVYSPDPILLNALCAIGREAGLKLQVLHSSFDPQSATEIARRNQAELLIRGDAATPEFESLEAKGFNDAGGKGWLGIYTSEAAAEPTDGTGSDRQTGSERQIGGDGVPGRPGAELGTDASDARHLRRAHPLNERTGRCRPLWRGPLHRQYAGQILE